jgi:hypothetical protein
LGGESIEVQLRQGEDILAAGMTSETSQTGWVYIDLDNSVTLQAYTLYAVEFNVPDGDYTYDGIHLGTSDTTVGNTWLGNTFSGEINYNNLDTPFKLARRSWLTFADFWIHHGALALKKDPSANRVLLSGGLALSESQDIDVSTEAVTLAVGSATIEIPEGSFAEVGSDRYQFSGFIDDIKVKMCIAADGSDSYSWSTQVIGLALSGLGNRVPISLTIGNDQGELGIGVKGALSLVRGKEAED